MEQESGTSISRCRSTVIAMAYIYASPCGWAGSNPIDSNKLHAFKAGSAKLQVTGPNGPSGVLGNKLCGTEFAVKKLLVFALGKYRIEIHQKEMKFNETPNKQTQGSLAK